MIVNGVWYQLGSAEKSLATLCVDSDCLVVTIQADNSDGVNSVERSIKYTISDVDVSDRLGNIERKLHFGTEGVFATKDNAAIDEIYRHHKKFNRWIHKVESHLGAVFVALAFTIALGVSFFVWGIPWASGKIANLLPHKANEIIAAEALTFLDDYWFDETTIPAQRQAEIRQHFTNTLLPLDTLNNGINYRLHFRNWSDDGKDIPNAFALPSGDIILTDQFIKLTENQNEMDSVLLHEIGHVVHRHTLKMVVQGTLVTTIVMLVTGDGSGLADMGAGLGALLVSNHYARGHESEADTYAFENMLKAGIDPQAFASIMNRMDIYMAQTFRTAKQESDANTEASDAVDKGREDKNIEASDAEASDTENSDINTAMNYLSTHPRTEERVRKAQQYSKCFRRGLMSCEVDE